MNFYFYAVIWLMLWLVVVMLLASNIRNAFTRSVSLLLFVGGCGALSMISMELFISDFPAATISHYSVRWTSIISMTAYSTLLSYAYVMSATTIHGWITPRMRLWIGILLVMPPAYSMTFHIDYWPVMDIDLEAIRRWSSVYVIAGTAVLLHAYICEKDPSAKRNVYRTALTLAPAIIMNFIFDSTLSGVVITRTQHIAIGGGTWRWNFIPALWLFGFSIYYAIKFGFLGIKLHIEKQRLDYSLRTLTLGTSILNHTIKNEVNKVLYLHERIDKFLEEDDAAGAKQPLQALRGVADHLLGMVNRIKAKTDDIVLKERVWRLRDIVEPALAGLQPMVDQSGARIQISWETDGLLRCDRGHVLEVFNNVCRNALDAVSADGKIDVRVFARDRYVWLEVRDNGIGIQPENLEHVFDPFFTTKKHPQNYGLGLSYCYAVMLEHDGRIEVSESIPGKGTVVHMKFPSSRFQQL